MKFDWSSVAQAAFEKLKESLVKTPVLKHIDHKKEFVSYADASKVGVAAVLIQEAQPIAYTSRTLNEAEINYSTTEREILVAV